MLGKFLSIFGKTSNKEVRREWLDDEGMFVEDNPSFIIELDRIHKILAEVETYTPLCTIQIKGFEEKYNSTILGVEPESNVILIDELVPKEGNLKLKDADEIKLSAFHKGIHLSFTINRIETGISRGITFYKATIPSRMYYPQRRKGLRVEIRKSNVQFYGTSERTGAPVSGGVFDLSRGGAGINLPTNRARVMRGDRLVNCQISIEDYLMNFDFDVRFVRPLGGGSSNVQIGGVFSSLTSKSQSKLSHFITSLERLEIRRQKS